MSRVAVVGGGITGLVAARTLALAGADVTLVDPGPLGGKVQTSAFDGGTLDEAADAFLARVPEGVELCRELGLEGELVSPAARRAHVWSRGALRPLPEAQLLGVPTDLDELAASGIVSPEGLERARLDLTLPGSPLHDDVSIGAVMRARLGDEVTERLVDPLVGGINAGDTDRLSLAATVPQLDAAVRSGVASLVEACRAKRASVADPAAPVFYAPRRGMGALPAALAADLDARGVAFVTETAEALAKSVGGWQLRLTSGGAVDVDGVVLAAPAGVSARLVGPQAPTAAELLEAIPYASVALVALAVPREGVDRVLDGSGFLVPRVEGRTVTACSWTTSKWPHLGGEGTVWLRASVGRDGHGEALASDDDGLLAHVLTDLRTTMELRGAPTEARVTRWPSSFPQYRPGHLDRVDAIDADVQARAVGIEVAGAALRGLGVPACIRQGAAAAHRLLATLGGST
ncbi:MAG: protoporphyrinogen oxidase [Acidimicrobiales bacterium]|nr:protoporphyrinogen oxidase [Acidimicrobiales bacterium]